MKLTAQFNPQIVGVEKLESFNGFEIVNMFLWYLSDFEKTQFVFVINESTTLEEKQNP